MERSPVFSSKDFAQVNSISVPQKVGTTSAWGIHSTARAHGPDDTTLFSSSLPVLPLEISKLDDMNSHSETTGNASITMNQFHQDGKSKGPDEDIDQFTIGSLLPDDEGELLAGMMDEFDLNDLPRHVEDLDDYDLFQTGGGIELDFQPQEKFNFSFANPNISDNYTTNGHVQYGLLNAMGAIVGEHPYGEHPSRTLFVRNINSNVEDSELRSLFEQFGGMRSLYSACKHRGFVMISYYDIRDARNAMRVLQNKPLRGRKLDIHFSIPKDNPSDKDMNQGTLVIFNLDPSVTNTDLRQIFGAYGEIKEIRETPHKKHHKFIEFYDVRAAEAALKSLNRSDIAGKRIKLEPSRPGGARRNMMQQLGQDLDQDETRSYRFQAGSPIGNSPPSNWPQYHPNEGSTLQSFSYSSSFGGINPIGTNPLLGLASILSPPSSNPVKIAPIGRNQGRSSHAEQVLFSSKNSFGEAGFPHIRSFPDNACGLMPNVNPVPGLITSSNASDVGTLTGPQFLWGSPTPFSEHVHSSTSPSPSNGQGHGHSYASQQTSLTSHEQYHVGSAPSGIPFQRQHGFFLKSPETTYMNAVSLGGSLNQGEGGFLTNVGNRSAMHSGVGLPSNMMPGNGPLGFQVFPSHHRMGHLLRGSSPFNGSFAGIDGIIDHGRSRFENSVSQLDSKKHYQLHLDKIVSGEDTRTTLMIKNIPNKYTSKMLLATIDEKHKGAYDFFYLPIDFKNKCNVGYAFINMVTPGHIIPFYETFNGKKWEKFNSEKVASLAYARIQGKSALVNHFQNSSLMNEDKRCRPILFHHDGSEAGDQEPFPSNNLNIQVHLPFPSFSSENSVKFDNGLG